jgi:ornithine carbamoyltransferase
MRHFLSVADLSADELASVLDHAARLKRDPEAARLPRVFAAALLFEQPSLRTRAAYEVALMHLGGRAILFETRLGQREDVTDVARTLSYLVSLVVARVRDHTSLQVLAEGARVPIVNALSNREHPVEVVADALTLRERWGNLAGRRLAYVGDGNNICHSLLLLAPLLGLDLTVASPAGYAAAESIAQKARALAAEQGTHLHLGTDPAAAVAGVDAVYTDVWASMGQEQSVEARRQAFEPYQVNAELLSLAQPGAAVLHCLPASRGQEITAGVLESPQSLAFDRLSNLVPVTTALLSWLLEQMEDKKR